MNEIPCGLSRQQPDQIDEASIGRRRRRHADSRAAPATTRSFSAVAVSARYDRVPVLTRNTPFRDNDAKSQCFDKLEFYQ
ncbi:hypothetical protein X751_30090 [Mesorhizobium sp. LNJC395A00]|nr:hypothetical protein X751_30090 [Mesorhizobium sp. LNJC395A00]